MYLYVTPTQVQLALIRAFDMQNTCTGRVYVCLQVW